MKKLALVFVVLAWGICLSSLQAQTLISGNFTAFSAPQSGAAVLASPSNGTTPDTWNNLPANSNTSLMLSNLVNSSNTPTSVGLSATFSSGNNNPVPPNGNGTAYDANTANLMESFIYGQVTINLSGLSAYTNDTFELVVYAAGDKTGQGANISLSGNVSGGNTGSTLTTTGTDRMISNGQGDAYQIFNGTITGGTLTISDSTQVNGFQLAIAPEPSTWVAMGFGLGVLGLIRFKRARLNS